MFTTLLILQVILALLLIFVIMIQEKGAGLGEAIGGSASSFQTSKRGAEKAVGNLTWILLVAFMGTSLILNFV